MLPLRSHIKPLSYYYSVAESHSLLKQHAEVTSCRFSQQFYLSEQPLLFQLLLHNLRAPATSGFVQKEAAT